MFSNKLGGIGKGRFSHRIGLRIAGRGGRG